MRLSRITLALGIFIVLSGTFMGQVLNFLKDAFSAGRVEIGLGILFVLIALSALLYVNRVIVSNKRKILFLILLCLGLYFSWRLEIFPERIHALEYGLLGWLIIRDCTRDKVSFLKIIYGILIILLFGCLDEALQWLLPYRVGEFKDVLLNGAGGLWGMGLFFIKNLVKNSP